VEFQVPEFTQEQADRHNALTRKGWSIIEERLIVDGKPSLRPPGWFERWRLRRAVRCFEQALEINSEGWQSMWALGKIHQRLGSHAAAFEWFSRAHVLNPTQVDVAREAGLAAMDCEKIAEAVVLCRAAVTNRPGDAGLVSNLALACCLAGDDVMAEQCAEEAVQRRPDDRISATVLRFVREVKSGSRTRPKRLCDAFPCE
jgi:tetratricopeptide (TPR) repeat protein